MVAHPDTVVRTITGFRPRTLRPVHHRGADRLPTARGAVRALQRPAAQRHTGPEAGPVLGVGTGEPAGPAGRRTRMG
ncbi:hypothetical protein [Streptosporangium sp. NPDC087985]|uniref:hypothetical protein n=1 Tax=Streptosporangium sp. NPDC087985 TaxID=3366196 RepID=UPI003816F351